MRLFIAFILLWFFTITLGFWIQRHERKVAEATIQIEATR